MPRQIRRSRIVFGQSRHRNWAFPKIALLLLVLSFLVSFSGAAPANCNGGTFAAETFLTLNPVEKNYNYVSTRCTYTNSLTVQSSNSLRTIENVNLNFNHITTTLFSFSNTLIFGRNTNIIIYNASTTQFSTNFVEDISISATFLEGSSLTISNANLKKTGADFTATTSIAINSLQMVGVVVTIADSLFDLLYFGFDEAQVSRLTLNISNVVAQRFVFQAWRGLVTDSAIRIHDATLRAANSLSSSNNVRLLMFNFAMERSSLKITKSSFKTNSEYNAATLGDGWMSFVDTNITIIDSVFEGMNPLYMCSGPALEDGSVLTIQSSTFTSTSPSAAANSPTASDGVCISSRGMVLFGGSNRITRGAMYVSRNGWEFRRGWSVTVNNSFMTRFTFEGQLSEGSIDIESTTFAGVISLGASSMENANVNIFNASALSVTYYAWSSIAKNTSWTIRNSFFFGSTALFIAPQWHSSLLVIENCVIQFAYDSGFAVTIGGQVTTANNGQNAQLAAPTRHFIANNKFIHTVAEGSNPTLLYYAPAIGQNLFVTVQQNSFALARSSARLVQLQVGDGSLVYDETNTCDTVGEFALVLQASGKGNVRARIANYPRLSAITVSKSFATFTTTNFSFGVLNTSVSGSVAMALPNMQRAIEIKLHNVRIGGGLSFSWGVCDGSQSSNGDKFFCHVDVDTVSIATRLSANVGIMGRGAHFRITNAVIGNSNADNAVVEVTQLIVNAEEESLFAIESSALVGPKAGLSVGGTIYNSAAFVIESNAFGRRAAVQQLEQLLLLQLQQGDSSSANSTTVIFPSAYAQLLGERLLLGSESVFATDFNNLTFVSSSYSATDVQRIISALAAEMNAESSSLFLLPPPSPLTIEGLFTFGTNATLIVRNNAFYVRFVMANDNGGNSDDAVAAAAQGFYQNYVHLQATSASLLPPFSAFGGDGFASLATNSGSGGFVDRDGIPTVSNAFSSPLANRSSVYSSQSSSSPYYVGSIPHIHDRGIFSNPTIVSAVTIKDCDLGGGDGGGGADSNSMRTRLIFESNTFTANVTDRLNKTLLESSDTSSSSSPSHTAIYAAAFDVHPSANIRQGTALVFLGCNVFTTTRAEDFSMRIQMAGGGMLSRGSGGGRGGNSTNRHIGKGQIAIYNVIMPDGSDAAPILVDLNANRSTLTATGTTTPSSQFVMEIIGDEKEKDVSDVDDELNASDTRDDERLSAITIVFVDKRRKSVPISNEAGAGVVTSNPNVNAFPTPLSSLNDAVAAASLMPPFEQNIRIRNQKVGVLSVHLLSAAKSAADPSSDLGADTSSSTSTTVLDSFFPFNTSVTIENVKANHLVALMEKAVLCELIVKNSHISVLHTSDVGDNKTAMDTSPSLPAAAARTPLLVLPLVHLGGSLGPQSRVVFSDNSVAFEASGASVVASSGVVSPLLTHGNTLFDDSIFVINVSVATEPRVLLAANSADENSFSSSSPDVLVTRNRVTVNASVAFGEGDSTLSPLLMSPPIVALAALFAGNHTEMQFSENVISVTVSNGAGDEGSSVGNAHSEYRLLALRASTVLLGLSSLSPLPSASSSTSSSSASAAVTIVKNNLTLVDTPLYTREYQNAQHHLLLLANIDESLLPLLPFPQLIETVAPTGTTPQQQAEQEQSVHDAAAHYHHHFIPSDFRGKVTVAHNFLRGGGMRVGFAAVVAVSQSTNDGMRIEVIGNNAMAFDFYVSMNYYTTLNSSSSPPSVASRRSLKAQSSNEGSELLPPRVEKCNFLGEDSVIPTLLSGSSSFELLQITHEPCFSYTASSPETASETKTLSVGSKSPSRSASASVSKSIPTNSLTASSSVDALLTPSNTFSGNGTTATRSVSETSSVSETNTSFFTGGRPTETLTRNSLTASGTASDTNSGSKATPSMSSSFTVVTRSSSPSLSESNISFAPSPTAAVSTSASDGGVNFTRSETPMVTATTAAESEDDGGGGGLVTPLPSSPPTMPTSIHANMTGDTPTDEGDGGGIITTTANGGGSGGNGSSTQPPTTTSTSGGGGGGNDNNSSTTSSSSPTTTAPSSSSSSSSATPSPAPTGTGGGGNDAPTDDEGNNTLQSTSGSEDGGSGGGGGGATATTSAALDTVGNTNTNADSNADGTATTEGQETTSPLHDGGDNDTAATTDDDFATTTKPNSMPSIRPHIPPPATQDPERGEATQKNVIAAVATVWSFAVIGGTATEFHALVVILNHDRCAREEDLLRASVAKYIIAPFRYFGLVYEVIGNVFLTLFIAVLQCVVLLFKLGGVNSLVKKSKAQVTVAMRGSYFPSVTLCAALLFYMGVCNGTLKLLLQTIEGGGGGLGDVGGNDGTFDNSTTPESSSPSSSSSLVLFTLIIGFIFMLAAPLAVFVCIRMLNVADFVLYYPPEGEAANSKEKGGRRMGQNDRGEAIDNADKRNQNNKKKTDQTTATNTTTTATNTTTTASLLAERLKRFLLPLGHYSQQDSTMFGPVVTFARPTRKYWALYPWALCVMVAVVINLPIGGGGGRVNNNGGSSGGGNVLSSAASSLSDLSSSSQQVIVTTNTTPTGVNENCSYVFVTLMILFIMWTVLTVAARAHRSHVTTIIITVTLSALAILSCSYLLYSDDDSVDGDTNAEINMNQTSSGGNVSSSSLARRVFSFLSDTTTTPSSTPVGGAGSGNNNNDNNTTRLQSDKDKKDNQTAETIKIVAIAIICGLTLMQLIYAIILFAVEANRTRKRIKKERRATGGGGDQNIRVDDDNDEFSDAEDNNNNRDGSPIANRKNDAVRQLYTPSPSNSPSPNTRIKLVLRHHKSVNNKNATNHDDDDDEIHNRNPIAGMLLRHRREQQQKEKEAIEAEERRRQRQRDGDFSPPIKDDDDDDDDDAFEDENEAFDNEPVVSNNNTDLNNNNTTTPQRRRRRQISRAHGEVQEATPIKLADSACRSCGAAAPAATTAVAAASSSSPSPSARVCIPCTPSPLTTTAQRKQKNMTKNDKRPTLTQRSNLSSSYFNPDDYSDAECDYDDDDAHKTNQHLQHLLFASPEDNADYSVETEQHRRDMRAKLMLLNNKMKNGDNYHCQQQRNGKKIRRIIAEQQAADDSSFFSSPPHHDDDDDENDYDNRVEHLNDDDDDCDGYDIVGRGAAIPDYDFDYGDDDHTTVAPNVQLQTDNNHGEDTTRNVHTASASPLRKHIITTHNNRLANGPTTCDDATLAEEKAAFGARALSFKFPTENDDENDKDKMGKQLFCELNNENGKKSLEKDEDVAGGNKNLHTSSSLSPHVIRQGRRRMGGGGGGDIALEGGGLAVVVAAATDHNFGEATAFSSSSMIPMTGSLLLGDKRELAAAVVVGGNFSSATAAGGGSASPLRVLQSEKRKKSHQQQEDEEKGDHPQRQTVNSRDQHNRSDDGGDATTTNMNDLETAHEGGGNYQQRNDDDNDNDAMMTTTSASSTNDGRCDRTFSFESAVSCTASITSAVCVPVDSYNPNHQKHNHGDDNDGARNDVARGGEANQHDKNNTNFAMNKAQNNNNNSNRPSSFSHRRSISNDFCQRKPFVVSKTPFPSSSIPHNSSFANSAQSHSHSHQHQQHHQPRPPLMARSASAVSSSSGFSSCSSLLSSAAAAAPTPSFARSTGAPSRQHLEGGKGGRGGDGDSFDCTASTVASTSLQFSTPSTPFNVAEEGGGDRHRLNRRRQQQEQEQSCHNSGAMTTTTMMIRPPPRTASRDEKKRFIQQEIQRLEEEKKKRDKAMMMVPNAASTPAIAKEMTTSLIPTPPPPPATTTATIGRRKDSIDREAIERIRKDMSDTAGDRNKGDDGDEDDDDDEEFITKKVVSVRSNVTPSVENKSASSVASAHNSESSQDKKASPSPAPIAPYEGAEPLLLTIPGRNNNSAKDGNMREVVSMSLERQQHDPLEPQHQSAAAATTAANPEERTNEREKEADGRSESTCSSNSSGSDSDESVALSTTAVYTAADPLPKVKVGLVEKAGDFVGNRASDNNHRNNHDGENKNEIDGDKIELVAQIGRGGSLRASLPMNHYQQQQQQHPLENSAPQQAYSRDNDGGQMHNGGGGDDGAAFVSGGVENLDDDCDWS